MPCLSYQAADQAERQEDLPALEQSSHNWSTKSRACTSASTHLIKDGIPLRFSVTDEDNPENSRAEIKVKLWSIQMGFMGVRSLTFVHHPKAFRIWLSLHCKVP